MRRGGHDGRAPPRGGDDRPAGLARRDRPCGLDLLNSTAAAGAVSAAAQSLTHEVLKTMFVQKLTIASAALMGAGLMAWAASAALIPRGDDPKAAPAAVAQRAAARPEADADPLDAVGTFPVRGRVLDPDGKPVAGAEIFVRHNTEFGWSAVDPVPAGQKGRVAVERRRRPVPFRPRQGVERLALRRRAGLAQGADRGRGAGIGPGLGRGRIAAQGG